MALDGAWVFWGGGEVMRGNGEQKRGGVIGIIGGLGGLERSWGVIG